MATRPMLLVPPLSPKNSALGFAIVDELLELHGRIMKFVEGASRAVFEWVPQAVRAPSSLLQPAARACESFLLPVGYLGRS